MIITKDDTENLLPWLIGIRRELHRNPELSLREYGTAKIIERELDAMGISHARVGETGVMATLRGDLPGGNLIALRADIDALPVYEHRDTAYRSVNDGVMHACGHDGHTAMLLGAAKLLSERRSSWGGEVRLCFQPAEEIGRGAKEFTQSGALEGVKRVFGLHVAPDLPCGTVGLKAGLNNAAVDGFRIEVAGKSSHVCFPEKGVDALYIASQIVVAVQAQVTRRSPAIEPVIIGIGTFHSGTTYNALAESAVLEGTTRTISPEARSRARKQVNATVDAIASLYGGSADVVWDDRGAALINDAGATAEAINVVRSQRPDINIVTDRDLSMSGDNFSEFQLHVPGVYGYLGTSNEEIPDTRNPIHSTSFEMDERALATGVWLHCAVALHWLSAPLS